MSHFIINEQNIFAYRKLISLLEEHSVKFFNNHFLDIKLFSELGIYEKNPIFIIFGLNEFWQDDAENSFVSIRLLTKKGKTLREGIDYLTSVYFNAALKERGGLPLPQIDPDFQIISDFPNLVEQQESDNEELIQRYLLLLLRIYELNIQQAIYNVDLIIEVKKGRNYNDILKSGSFTNNINALYGHFDRSNFGSVGNFLLSFKKQLEFTRELIKIKIPTYGIHDIVITPQVAISQRKNQVSPTTEHVFDATIRLLDCLFYLESIGEIKILDLTPHRVVLDATNLSLEQTQKGEVDLNSILKLVPNGRKIDVVIKDNDEKLYDFENKQNNLRLKLFTAIASKYPNPATRTEVVNQTGIKQGKTKNGEFYKMKVYSTILTLSKALKKKSKGKISIDTSKAAETGYLLEINQK